MCRGSQAKNKQLWIRKLHCILRRIYKAQWNRIMNRFHRIALALVELEFSPEILPLAWNYASYPTLVADRLKRQINAHQQRNCDFGMQIPFLFVADSTADESRDTDTGSRI